MNEDVGILCIGTGKYSALLPELLRSVRLYFLPGHSKRFYVFTDAAAPAGQDMCRVERRHAGWPADTLERYGMFMSIAAELQQHRFLYYFNANMRPVAPIGREVLPTADRPLVAVRHQRRYTLEELATATEQRQHSRAYIPRLPYTYVAGGFNGGRAADFIAMAATIDRWQREDATAGLVPVWHDESYLNAYRVQQPNRFRLLSPAYLFPEGWQMDYPCRIVCLDKNRFFNTKNFR